MVVIGLGLVVGGVQFSHFTGLTEFTYTVEATTQAAIQGSNSGERVLYPFTELSSTAQDAFLRAYEASDHRITIRGWEHQVTELDHTGDTPARPGDGLYYVTYQENYYEFTLRQPAVMTGPAMLFGYALAVGGAILGVYGGRKHRSCIRSLLTLVSGVVVFLAVYGVAGWWGLTDVLTLFAVGALCTALPAVGVWSIYGHFSP